ncbi:DUF805 domain-containing protein [Jiella sp. M17.18]|uniref:DUF805 domain-containing protein n=1 Tax=Jiella sp. M17.18 TaxID=3234247 RepID=UPI0034DFB7BE
MQLHIVPCGGERRSAGAAAWLPRRRGGDVSSLWYVVDAGQQAGPYEEDVLASLARAGLLEADSYVWRDGMADWQFASETELARLFPRTPGPPAFSELRPDASSERGTGAAAGALRWSPTGDPARSPFAAPQERLEASLPGASLGQAFSRFWKKYADFRGRASRSEFWYAELGIVLLAFAIGFAEQLLAPRTGLFVGDLYSLAALIPSLSIAVRRLHDTGRSGWYYLLVFIPLVGALVLLVFFCQRSDERPNRFGY